jgi:hypothetical protein
MDAAARIWFDWLPQDLRIRSTRDEPARFARAVQLVVDAVAEAKASSSGPDSLAPTLLWIDLLKGWAASAPADLPTCPSGTRRPGRGTPRPRPDAAAQGHSIGPGAADRAVGSCARAA